MNQSKNYQIKPGYRCNESRVLDVDPQAYLDERLNRVAQYYVYRQALVLARSIGAKNILDVGCGMGLKLAEHFYREFNVFGVDGRAAILKAREAMPNGTFSVEDLHNPRFEMKKHLATADLIICADVIEHLSDPDIVLKFIREFAGEGTLVVLSTPDRDCLHGVSNNQPRNPCHVREWNFSEFAAYIRASSFRIISHDLVLSNQLRFDLATLEWIFVKLLKGIPIRHTQMLVCKVVET